jgi:hypothetical protein
MLTANGLPVIGMTFTQPLTGLWVATLEIASEEEVDGELVIEQEGAATSYVGVVTRTGLTAGSCYVEAVGGVGLTGDVGARSYQGATARAVIAEILAETGDALDSASTRATMITDLPYWTRATGRGTSALWALADALVARWRVQPSGAVWFGVDAWPAAPDYEFTELERDHIGQSVTIAPETIDLRPGLELANGDRVGRIIYNVGRDSYLRATYWLAE